MIINEGARAVALELKRNYINEKYGFAHPGTFISSVPNQDGISVIYGK